MTQSKLILTVESKCVKKMYNRHLFNFFNHLNLTKLEYNPCGSKEIICNAAYTLL